MNRFVLVAGMVAARLQAAFGADAPEAYRKLWNDAVNAGIDERIERHRKADATAEGFPAGAEVKVEQVSHDFQFGSHIFNFDQLINREWKTRLKLKADGNGRIAFRGFRGQYRLSWTDADGRTETREVGVR